MDTLEVMAHYLNFPLSTKALDLVVKKYIQDEIAGT